MITEPMTMMTDYLLALACLMFAIQTYRLRGSHSSVVFWIFAFGAGAIAALLGGTFHGFKTYFNPASAKSLWDFTMILIGATAAFMIAASMMSSLGRSEMDYVRWIRRGLLVSAAGFAIQKIGWDLHPQFNHNDLYHMVQIAGFWCLYQGVRRMG